MDGGSCSSTLPVRGRPHWDGGARTGPRAPYTNSSRIGTSASRFDLRWIPTTALVNSRFNSHFSLLVRGRLQCHPDLARALQGRGRGRLRPRRRHRVRHATPSDLWHHQRLPRLAAPPPESTVSWAAGAAISGTHGGAGGSGLKQFPARRAGGQQASGEVDRQQRQARVGTTPCPGQSASHPPSTVSR